MKERNDKSKRIKTNETKDIQNTVGAFYLDYLRERTLSM